MKMISSVTFHRTFFFSLSLYLWPQEGGIDSQTPFANFVSYETMDNFHGYVGLLDSYVLRLVTQTKAPYLMVKIIAMAFR